MDILRYMNAFEALDHLSLVNDKDFLSFVTCKVNLLSNLAKDPKNFKDLIKLLNENSVRLRKLPDKEKLTVVLYQCARNAYKVLFAPSSSML